MWLVFSTAISGDWRRFKWRSVYESCWLSGLYPVDWAIGEYPGDPPIRAQTMGHMTSLHQSQRSTQVTWAHRSKTKKVVWHFSQFFKSPVTCDWWREVMWPLFDAVIGGDWRRFKWCSVCESCWLSGLYLGEYPEDPPIRAQTMGHMTSLH